MVQRAAVIDRRTPGMSAMRLVAIITYIVVNFAIWSALPSLHLGGGALVRLAAMLALIFVATLIHELGHAVAVHAVGGRIHAIMVMPLRLQLQPRRLKFARPAGVGDLGGYVSYTLDRIEPRRGHAIIAAAGPAANIALYLLASLAVVLLSDAQAPVVLLLGDQVIEHAGPAGLPSQAEVSAWIFRQQWLALIGALGTLSLGMALLNLIPFRGSDGDHILRALSARYRNGRKR